MAKKPNKDWNDNFDIPKLISMDPGELKKLLDMYPHFRIKYGPKFTEDIWAEFMETFFLKAHQYDAVKSKGKIWGWLNIIIHHTFIRCITYAKKRKRKIEYVFYEDTFSSSSPTSPENEKMPEEAKKILVEEFDFDAHIDHPNGEPDKMYELIDKYAIKGEKEILELYIRGAKITNEEKKIIINFKNRVLRRIYRPDQLAALRKSKKHLSKSKKNINNRIRDKQNTHYKSNEYLSMTPEQKKEFRIKKRDERRVERLKKFKETLSPKDYEEKLRQLEYYKKVHEKQNKNNIDNHKKIVEKTNKEKEELRESIKKEQKNGKIL